MAHAGGEKETSSVNLNRIKCGPISVLSYSTLEERTLKKKKIRSVCDSSASFPVFFFERSPNPSKAILSENYVASFVRVFIFLFPSQWRAVSCGEGPAEELQISLIYNPTASPLTGVRAAARAPQRHHCHRRPWPQQCANRCVKSWACLHGDSWFLFSGTPDNVPVMADWASLGESRPDKGSSQLL